MEEWKSGRPTPVGAKNLSPHAVTRHPDHWRPTPVGAKNLSPHAVTRHPDHWRPTPVGAGFPRPNMNSK